MAGTRRIVREIPATDAAAAALPRDDILLEQRVGDDGSGSATVVFEQVEGPFTSYERRIEPGESTARETIRYEIRIPWFGWLFAVPVRETLKHRPKRSGHRTWWAPPDRMSPRPAAVLGLLAAASMASAFTNTLFGQTANYAAKDFGIDNYGQGVGGVVVRMGVVLALPIVFLADRAGRRKMIVLAAFLAPIFSFLGALAPSFPALVATQSIGRPMGLALDALIAVVAAEEMPRNSRAYAVSLLAMASGLGAGIAVMGLPLADLGDAGWRLVYVLALIWLIVAFDLRRRLPETQRFQRPHVIAPRIPRIRFAQLAAVGFFANMFVAPASFFQNRYLDEVRGFSAGRVALFTLATATPAAIGLVIGGRIADVRGRRHLLVVALPLSTALGVWAFTTTGFALWLGTFGAGFIGAIAFPAFAVYRTELFPTGNRARSAGLLTAAGLVGGSIGLLATGQLLDRGWSYGSTIGLMAIGQVVAVAVIALGYPETAHKDLDELNPEPPVLSPDAREPIGDSG